MLVKWKKHKPVNIMGCAEKEVAYKMTSGQEDIH